MTSVLIKMAEYGAERTQLETRFIAAWWAAENGYTWDETTNNPGNVSYEGEGIPSGGIFSGVTEVLSNKVCVYDTALHGVEAWASLLEAPTQAHGGDKVLTVDLEDLRACGGNLHCMAAKIGASNWAGGHYVDTLDPAYNWPGGLIVGAYQSSVMDALMTAATADPILAPEAPLTSFRSRTYDIASGDTLSQIAVRFRVPLGVLARYNHIDNPDRIDAGTTLHIPDVYKIRSGDTLSEIAARFHEAVEVLAYVNQMNPDVIYAGQMLYY